MLRAGARVFEGLLTAPRMGSATGKGFFRKSSEVRDEDGEGGRALGVIWAVFVTIESQAGDWWGKLHKKSIFYMRGQPYCCISPQCG